MPYKYWRGGAAAVAQVSTITVGGTIAIGDKFLVTINKKSVTFTATTTTIAHVVAGLVDLLNATTAPIEHSELTWTASSPTIVGTADVAGVPHTITVSETGAASTIAIATTVAATGPNFEDNAANWSDGVALDDDDALVFDTGNVSVLYGWTTKNTTRREITAGYGGNIGLPAINALGYPEYRQRYPLSAAEVTSVYGSGQYLILAGPLAIINVHAGTVELFYKDAAYSTGATLRIDAGATVILSSVPWEGFSNTVVFTEIVNAGSLYADPINQPTITTIASSGETSIQYATTMQTRGGNTSVFFLTTLRVYGGTVAVIGNNSTGTLTLTTVVIGPDIADGEDAILDLSQAMTLVAITNLTLNGRGSILDPHQRLTGTHTLTINASKISTG